MRGMRTTPVAALILVIAGSAVALRAQAVPTAAWAPKPAQTPAYPPGHQPWVKLADLKARHKGDANWRELVVDDGRLTGEYVSAAPGTKIGAPLPSRHARVVRGVSRRGAGRHRGPAAVHGDARLARQHPAPDDLLARNDRRRAEPAMDRQRRAREDALSARRRAAAPPPGHGLDRRHRQPHARPLRRVQPAAPEHPRGRGEEREVHAAGASCATTSRRCSSSTGTRRTCRRSIRPTKDTFIRRARSSGWSSPARFATRSRARSRSSPAKATSSTCQPTRGTRRGSSARTACRLSITEYVGNTLLLEPRKR